MRDEILLRQQVLERVKLSNATVWREQKRGRFPKWDEISIGRVGLRESVLSEWLAGKRDWTA